jgi:hypothetical protein
MDTNDSDNPKISRKKFFQITGSVIAGGTLLGATGYLLKNRSRQLNQIADTQKKSTNTDNISTFQSPYKLVGAFRTPAHIDSFEFYNGEIIIATLNNVSIYQPGGNLVNNFAVGSGLRDIAVNNDLIYLLFPARIEVYDFSGNLKKDWEACGENSDYCSIAVSPDYVFATDTSNKNICQYSLEGGLIRFIESPNRFIIPSYSFGITYANGQIYCSNPGRHSVEQYSVSGEYLGAFGGPGEAPGRFCGCCNPVYLSYTPRGEIITSEKGNPRISCYDSQGNFRNVLLGDQMLGGGSTAYDVKVYGDKIWIAGDNIISTFQYDKRMALRTGCSACGIDCPLKEGTLG